MSKERTFLGKLWRGIAKGAIKEVPLVGGIIHNAVEDTDEAPSGTIDWTQVVGQVLVVVAVVAVIAGWIDRDTANWIIELF
jgi:hypothetical protein